MIVSKDLCEGIRTSAVVMFGNKRLQECVVLRRQRVSSPHSSGVCLRDTPERRTSSGPKLSRCVIRYSFILSHLFRLLPLFHSNFLPSLNALCPVNLPCSLIMGYALLKWLIQCHF